MNGPELVSIVQRLAADPTRWAHLVEHDPERRRYEELLRDDELAVWLICWMDDQDTGFHDHDLSCGAVAVVEGEVAEDRLVLGGAPVTRRFARGGPADAVHDALTAYDTSSYGPRALDAMLRVVGVDRLLYGSDRPVIEPVAIAALGAAAEHAIAVTNPERFV